MDPLAYLFALERFGIKFGLDNIATLVARLGHPDRAFKSIHIAGTNGKGSVTAMVDAGLRAAGHRSARYTSPHLVDLRERFVIDGQKVARDALVAVVADVRDAIEALRSEGTLAVAPTFFEMTTAVALELFRRSGVEAAVLEVGLGGRLDATNIVTPVATAITSIAFDHQMYLGSTLAEIAFEKAGIIKPRVPVVVGELEPAALDVIARIAADRRAELIRTRADEVGALRVGLAGDHQRKNAAVAKRLLETLDSDAIRVPPDAIARGLADPGWPGRLDLRRLSDGRELLLDAAHNPAGAAALASYLHAHEQRLPLVFAAMRDKDAAGMFAALLPEVGSLVLTRASNSRAADPATLAGLAGALAPDVPTLVEPAPADALAAAWQSSRRIVVAGSIFLLGDVMEHLGLHW